MADVEAVPAETLAIYGVYIDYIRHENDLLNHRTTWFIAIESLLVAGAAYLLLRYFESAIALVSGHPDETLPHIIEFVIAGAMLCAFGIATARAASRSINGAIASQCQLDVKWRELAKHLAGAKMLPDMMGGKCTPPQDGQHFAGRLVFTMLVFWWLASAALGLLVAIMVFA